MKGDLHRTFGEIFNHDISALQRQLIEIQRQQADREKSLKWFQKLRFLDVSNVPDLARLSEERSVRSMKYDSEGQTVRTKGDRPILSIPLVEEDESDGFDTSSYVAVSWKWTGHNEQVPHGCGLKESFEYHIQRPGQWPHPSSFPHSYMDRVIHFAQAHNIANIWIDKECIYQKEDDMENHPQDQELGVQVMDLVYETATRAVGLLTAALMHQTEVDTLARLLKGDIFANNISPSSQRSSPG